MLWEEWKDRERRKWGAGWRDEWLQLGLSVVQCCLLHSHSKPRIRTVEEPAVTSLLSFLKEIFLGCWFSVLCSKRRSLPLPYLYDKYEAIASMALNNHNFTNKLLTVASYITKRYEWYQAESKKRQMRAFPKMLNFFFKKSKLHQPQKKNSLSHSQWLIFWCEMLNE